MSYRANHVSEADERRRKRAALQEQMRQLDEEERGQQPQHSFSHLSGSRTQAGLPLQHLWQNDTSSSWRDRQSTPTHPRPSQSQSHAGSSYPHSQARASPSSLSRASAHSHQPQTAMAQPTAQTAVLTSEAALKECINLDGRFVPVPSATQVNDYLINHLGQVDGLSTGFSVQGYRFDVYLLFMTVIQMGGSSSVSRLDQWPISAAVLKFPLEPSLPSQLPRSSAIVGRDLREFFLRMLGGLEILWDRTKAAESQADRARQQVRTASLSANSSKSIYQTGGRASQAPSPSRASHVSASTKTSSHLQVQDLTTSTSTSRQDQSHLQAQTYPPSTSLYQPDHEQEVRYHQSTNRVGSAQPHSPTLQSVHDIYQRQYGSQGTTSLQPTLSPVYNQDSQRNLPSASAPYPAYEPRSRSASTSNSVRIPNQTAGQATFSSQPMSARKVAQNGAGSSTPAKPNEKLDYDPPIVGDFDSLVRSQALPLPRYGSDRPLPHFTSFSSEYAWRAHELRTSIRKTSVSETHRMILPEEIMWWNKLVIVLQKNPKVVIPKPPSSAPPTAAQGDPSPSSPPQDVSNGTIDPSPIQNSFRAVPSTSNPMPYSARLAQPEAEPLALPVEVLDTPAKKKGSRPSKSDTLTGGAGDGHDGLSSANTAVVAVKKKKPGRPPKDRTSHGPPPPKKARGRPKKSLEVTASGDMPRETPHNGSVNPAFTNDAQSGGANTAAGRTLYPYRAAALATSSLVSELSQQEQADVEGSETENGTVPVLLPPPEKRVRSSKIAGFKQPVGRPRKEQSHDGILRPISPFPTGAATAIGISGSSQHSVVATTGPSFADLTNGSSPTSEFLRMIYARQKTDGGDQAPVELFPLVHAADPSGAPIGQHEISSLAGTSSHGQHDGSSDPGTASTAALARWNKEKSGRLSLPGFGQPKAPGKVGRPRKSLPASLKAHSVVNSASPKRVLHLSGPKVSEAQISNRDSELPTKVLIKKVKKTRTSMLPPAIPVSDGPATLADVMVDDNAEDEFDPFATLSQSFRPPTPPRYVPQGTFTPYTPIMSFSQAPQSSKAGPFTPREESVPPETKVEETIDFSMNMPDVEREPEMEVEETPLFVSKGKGKGKVLSKAPSKGRQATEVEIVLPSYTAGKGEGKGAVPKPQSVAVVPVTTRSKQTDAPPTPVARNFATRTTPASHLPLSSQRATTSQQPSTSQKAAVPKTQAISQTTTRVTRSQPSPPPPQARTPANRHVHKKPMSQIHTPTGSHMTRSIAGPPSSFLRARPRPSPLSQSTLAKRVVKPAPRRAERSPSIVAIERPQASKTVKPVKRKREVIEEQLAVIELTEEEKEEARLRRLTEGAVDRVKVVIPIKKGRRRRLISAGYYDAFRDDDSDVEEEAKRAVASLRPVKPLPNRSTARSIRAREPEVVPDRFLHRSGPEIPSAVQSVLDGSTLLRRSIEHVCGWKGCDAVLGSESLLKKHLSICKHTAEAIFKAPNNQQLWKCHWKSCEGPCFDSEAQLNQHLTARHVSRVLHCPFNDCGLTSPNVSHLARHVMKQHEDETPRPLADLSHQLPPAVLPSPPLPANVRTDELTTQPVFGKAYGSQYRREWVKLRVANNCFGGENPTMHVDHAPHMLGAAPEEEDDEDVSDEEESLLDAKEMAEKRLLDKAEGKGKRRWEAVVLVWRRGRDKAVDVKGSAASKTVTEVIDLTYDLDSEEEEVAAEVEGEGLDDIDAADSLDNGSDRIEIIETLDTAVNDSVIKSVDESLNRGDDENIAVREGTTLEITAESTVNMAKAGDAQELGLEEIFKNVTAAKPDAEDGVEDNGGLFDETNEEDVAEAIESYSTPVVWNIGDFEEDDSVPNRTPLETITHEDELEGVRDDVLHQANVDELDVSEADGHDPADIIKDFGTPAAFDLEYDHSNESAQAEDLGEMDGDKHPSAQDGGVKYTIGRLVGYTSDDSDDEDLEHPEQPDGDHVFGDAGDSDQALSDVVQAYNTATEVQVANAASKNNEDTVDEESSRHAASDTVAETVDQVVIDAGAPDASNVTVPAEETTIEGKVAAVHAPVIVSSREEALAILQVAREDVVDVGHTEHAVLSIETHERSGGVDDIHVPKAVDTEESGDRAEDFDTILSPLSVDDRATGDAVPALNETEVVVGDGEGPEEGWPNVVAL